MVGQNLGARKPERAERAVYLTGFYNMMFPGCRGRYSFRVPDAIVAFFTPIPVVSPYAVDCLRIIALRQSGLCVRDGDGPGVQWRRRHGHADLINVIGFWLCEIPLAWCWPFLPHMGVRGVFYRNSRFGVADYVNRPFHVPARDLEETGDLTRCTGGAMPFPVHPSQ